MCQVCGGAGPSGGVTGFSSGEEGVAKVSGCNNRIKGVVTACDSGSYWTTRPPWRGSVVLCHCDNQAVVSVIKV